MFDLKAIKRRHAAGSPAAEDMGDLIAEVERLQSSQLRAGSQETKLSEEKHKEILDNALGLKKESEGEIGEQDG